MCPRLDFGNCARYSATDGTSIDGRRPISGGGGRHAESRNANLLLRLQDKDEVYRPGQRMMDRALYPETGSGRRFEMSVRGPLDRGKYVCDVLKTLLDALLHC